MKTILVIEDNPDNMDLIEEILDDEGFNLLKAMLAEDGIDLLKHHTADVIVMDVSLPKMSGLEATKVFKTDDRTKHIPILILTAHAMQSDHEMALSAGCDAFLTKPINEEQLIETIYRLLNIDH